MTFNDLTNFAAFYATASEQKLPFKVSYKLRKLSTALDTEFEFYREKIREIFNKYGEKDENGQLITNEQGVKIMSGQIENCQRELDELGNIEITLPEITFAPDDFETLTLSAREIDAIAPFIVE